MLLGFSGCGHSVTVRMTAGLRSVAGGEIALGDRVAHGPPFEEQHTSMVFQPRGLYPYLPVDENVGFRLRLRRVPKERHHDMIMTAIRTVEFVGFRDRRPAELPGRQRVALGRTIVAC